MPRAEKRPPLVIRPTGSRRLLLFLLLVYGLTLATIPLLPLSAAWRFTIALGLVLGLIHGLGGAVWHLWPWSPRQAIWHGDGSWTLGLGRGREEPARLLGTTFVSPVLVILNFRYRRWRSGSLVLLSDNLDPDLLRRLRVRLRGEGRWTAQGPPSLTRSPP